MGLLEPGHDAALLKERAMSDDADFRRNTTTKPLQGADFQPPAQVWRVIFQLGEDTAKAFGVEVRGATVIGRADETSGEKPQFDLAPYGAMEAGVSRRHAVLMPTDNTLALMDLDSTNGTYINGVRVEPGQKYALRAGARVAFGRLQLTVRVVGTSEDSEDREQTARIISKK
jgi:pSer/pThr/pTyr-binding forkhead associated (FHA) protein